MNHAIYSTLSDTYMFPTYILATNNTCSTYPSFGTGNASLGTGKTVILLESYSHRIVRYIQNTNGKKESSSELHSELGAQTKY